MGILIRGVDWVGFNQSNFYRGIFFGCIFGWILICHQLRKILHSSAAWVSERHRVRLSVYDTVGIITHYFNHSVTH